MDRKIEELDREKSPNKISAKLPISRRLIQDGHLEPILRIKTELMRQIAHVTHARSIRDAQRGGLVDLVGRAHLHAT